MKHTPGPWRVKVDQFIKDVKLFSVVSESGAVADCAENNASLIASAPDLLKACETTLDVLNVYSNEVIEHDMIAPMWVNDLKDHLIIIITKARGETS